MKIKNGELNIFLDYISPIPLSSTEGRMRNKFKKILIEFIQEYDAYRQELVKEYSRKDENETPLTIINSDNQEVGDIEDLTGFTTAFNALANEYVHIDETIMNRQMLTILKTISLNDSKEYFGVESDIWEFVCERFEEIKYEDEGEN